MHYTIHKIKFNSLLEKIQEIIFYMSNNVRNVLSWSSLFKHI